LQAVRHPASPPLPARDLGLTPSRLGGYRSLMRRSEARWAFVVLAALPVAAVAAVALSARQAAAAEVTDVATAFDKNKAFEFHFRVGYDYTYKQASIKREHEGPGQDSVQLFKDLVYKQQRHTMSLRAEAGIYHDLAVHIELPFVLSDTRELSYDQRLGSECIYTGADANCVNGGNSSTTNSSVTGDSNDSSDPDPTHYIVPHNGFDATQIDPKTGMATGFAAGSDMVFRGPKRGGSGGDLFDTINFGLTWGVLSQKRDPSKPTWIVGLTYMVSIGNIMQFDRMRPDANHAVSNGLDHVFVRTAVSHRFRWVDPYVQFWFDYPFARRDDTLFKNYGPQEKNPQPQMSGGTRFGLEGVPWEKNDGEYKVAIDLNGRIAAVFDGRGYSEAWEMFASSPALACETDPKSVNYNASCDPNAIDTKTNMPWGGTNAYQGKPFTGLTVIENYSILGAELALYVQAGKHIRFRTSFLYTHDQSHFITADDVGIPFNPSAGNGCQVPLDGGRVYRPCEFNPAFRPVINEPGRRYKVDNVDVFNFGLWLQGMF
jgi:hypothetical protein